MLKAISCILMVAVFAPRMASGELLNGLSWERMDETGKTFLLTGYLNGFWLGTVHGADFGVETSSGYLKELSSSSVYGVKIYKEYWKCGISIEKNRETILDAAARYAGSTMNQPVSHYIEDLNAFYKRFPSCKGRDLMEILRGISLVWLKIRTYEEIGEECPKEQ